MTAPVFREKTVEVKKKDTVEQKAHRDQLYDVRFFCFSRIEFQEQQCRQCFSA